MNHVTNSSVWVERYRPQTIEDCILPKKIKETFLEFIKQEKFPNLILAGKPGTGKTTAAKALCRQLGFDYIVINGSLNRGIDVLRVDIQQYASTLSMTGNHKVVILDEADSLTSTFQPALRNFMEEFSDVCSFILTCNYKKKIIEPLHSRCSVIDFVIPKEEKKILIAHFTKRVMEILSKEEITFDKQVVLNFIMKHFPDNRKVLNELQAYAAGGVIDEGILTRFDTNITLLVEHLKAKNFTAMKKWVAENVDDSNQLFSTLYQELYSILKPENIPQAIILLNEYQYKASHVADQEINTVACLTELMHDCF